jgi:hypothetical protein
MVKARALARRLNRAFCRTIRAMASAACVNLKREQTSPAWGKIVVAIHRVEIETGQVWFKALYVVCSGGQGEVMHRTV